MKNLYSNRAGCLRMVGIITAFIILVLFVYRLFVLPGMNTWGATPPEIAATLPGDELVMNPIGQTTQAVTIRAKPEQIYPWLLQIGVDRGGMYSYDSLENLFGLKVHTIDRIVPELQSPKSGDFWPFTPKDFAIPDGPGVFVMKLEPNRAVIGCFGVQKAPPPPCTGTWQLVLQPQNDGTTRLILRARTDAASPMTGIFGAIFEPITFVMQRGMLLSFRDRIEATSLAQLGNSPSTGSSSISWPEARQLILDGKVKQVVQAHSLQVTLTLGDGSVRNTIEPQIDDVIQVVRECGDRCKDTGLLTE